MPGVYQDRSTGEYRYYTINEYEDRRKRDYDDAYNRKPDPVGQAPPWYVPPFVPWVPTAATPPGVTWVSLPQNELTAFLAAINAPAAPVGPLDNVAILTGDAFDPHQFDRLIESLPHHVGENPAFDALFNNGGVVAQRQALGLMGLEVQD